MDWVDHNFSIRFWVTIWVVNSSKSLKDYPKVSVSRSFSFAGSSGCEEFRSGQKLQNSHFESAAYANFGTPAANAIINSLPKGFSKPIGLSPLCRLRRVAAEAHPPRPDMLPARSP
jgi:hypothetical protein